jgi:multidrug efflux pump subunit AcrA (membrane-fusion protein)
VADESDIPQIPKERPRHRMRRSLSWPAAGARRAGGALPNVRDWSRRRTLLFVALVLSLVVAAVGIAVLPGKWREASAGAAPSPTGPRLVEASVGTIKRVIILQGLVVRESDEEVHAPANGTITSITVKQGDEVTAGKTLGVITLPPPAPILPSPLPSISPTPTLSPTPTTSASPSPTSTPTFSPFPSLAPQVQSVAAPIDGTVKDIKVVLSQVIKTGRLLFVIEPKKFDVIAPVRASLLYQFFDPPIAITGTIERGPAPFHCRFVSVGNNLEVTGAQSLMGQDADLRCSIPVAVEVFPGIRVRLDVTTAEVDNVLVLPRRVILFEGGKSFVRIVEKGHPVVRRQVELGLTDGQRFAVTSGLAAGEQVLDPASD